jgi:hypothetical protein
MPGVVETLYLDFAVDNLGDTTYVEMDPALDERARELNYKNTSDGYVSLSVGRASGSEADDIILPPGEGMIKYQFSKGQRIAVVGYNTGITINTGELFLEFVY